MKQQLIGQISDFQSVDQFRKINEFILEQSETRVYLVVCNRSHYYIIFMDKICIFPVCKHEFCSIFIGFAENADVP